MLDYGYMGGYFPATVKSYDQSRRTCRVEIKGITDGAEVLPEAEIIYPIGDKSREGGDQNHVHDGVTFFPTEIEICPSDTVWVTFIGGDARYPLIVGYRNPRSGNHADWRRWHHKNIEIIADDELRLVCGVPDGKETSTIIMTPTTIYLDAKAIIRNAPHPRPFLPKIYRWWHELNDSVAEWAGDIFRKKGCTKQCQKGKG